MLALDATTEIGTREVQRDMVNRRVSAGAISPLRRSLIAWDSFQRVDNAAVVGAPDGAPVGVSAWVTQIGTFGILTNRLYNVTTGNNIATLDMKSSDYDFEYQVSTAGTQFNTVFGYVDSSNLYRIMSNGNVQRIIAGGVDKLYGVLSNWTPVAGDILRVRKEGVWVTIYRNDRPVDSIQLTDANDLALKPSTIVGIQASGAAASYFVNFMARFPS